MSSRQAKQLLRKEIKKRIAALGSNEIQRQSDVVTQLLFRTDIYKQSERISVFLSMKDEINTHRILEDVFASLKQCFIPRYIGPKMDMVRLHSMADYDALPETSWHIKQPTENDVREDAMETGGLDLILMPGLAFSDDGARLGRGRGYYDTYLTRLEESTGKMPHTVALTFNEAISDRIPMEKHDRLIDMVIYENSK